VRRLKDWDSLYGSPDLPEGEMYCESDVCLIKER
jgi:hypothetical protein